ncbi:MAG: hypothetical protein AAF483_31135 [Planctomycetota bacterium]
MAFRNLISSLTGKKGRKKTSARKLDRRRVLAAPENLEARKMLTTTGVVTDQDFYASSSEFSGGLNTTVRQSFIVEVDGALDSVEVGIFRTGGSFPITFEVFESNLNADVLGPALGTQVVMSNDLVTFGSGNLSTVDFSGQGIDVELGDRLVILATKPSGAPTSPNIRGRLGNEYMEGRMRPGPASWDLFFRTNILTTFNEAPELDLGTTDPSEYVAGGAPAEVLDTLSIADNDDAELLQATISVSANYLSSEDVLSVDTLSLPAGITSSGFDSVTGTLTLTGAATLADYQDALRTVAYTNTSSTPDLTTRSITVTVEDANSSSSINGTLTDSATRDVEISDVTPGVTVENGVLQVIGTEDADRVKVFKFWNRYYVFTNIDGAKFTKVPASDVDEIYVDTRGGNDRIKVGAFTSTPATLIGGEGDDRIRGGAGDDTIFGGDGQDWIDAGWGNDIVYGGAGSEQSISKCIGS